MINHVVEGSWLNVNRACNLRCEWCYAAGSGFRREENMSLDLALKLIDLKYDLGVRNIIILGGEPLIYNHLYEILDYCKEKGIATMLVTNGVMFSNESVVEKIVEHTPDQISISLKAHNQQGYIDLTGRPAFNNVISGMHNLRMGEVSFDVSVTYSTLVKDGLVEMSKIAFENGASNIVITFCTTVFIENQPLCTEKDSPLVIVKDIVSLYDKLNAVTEGNVVISQSLPFCIWPSEFLDLLVERNQLSYGCVTLQKSGVIFDPRGYVLACNSLHDIRLGQYGYDFIDRDSFCEFWESEKAKQVFDGLLTYPSISCIKCSKYDMCGGGCPLRWFVYNPRDIIPNERR
jgi:radical SAM protein with 4Fe4S-binding SPASM domain